MRQRDAHKLPVARRRVLAGGDLREPAVRRERGLGPRQRRDARDPPQPQRGKVRERRTGLRERVVEGVCAGVAESRGVRERADADGIEHDQGDGHPNSIAGAT